jgi:uncharacterized membrane protein
MALAAIVLAGGLLRAVYLGKESLWLDESFSHWFSSRPLMELWTTVPLYETHPPLYYTILKAWRAAFGDSEAALRALSALAGTLTIPLVYILGRQAAGPLAGVLAAAMFALSPTHIYHSQEARPYALLVLAATWAMCGALWLTANPDQASRPLFGLRGTPGGAMESGGRERRAAPAAWAALIAGSAASLWLHNISGTLIVALIASVFPQILQRPGDPRGFLVNAFWAGVVILALWSPFLVMFLKQAGNVAGNFWMDNIRLWIIYAGLKEIFFLFIYSWPIMIFLLALAGYGLLWIRAQRGMAAAWSLAGLTLIPLILIIGVSYTVKPIFVPRTILWVTVPFFVMAGAGLAAASGEKWIIKAPLLAAAFAGFLYGDFDYLTSTNREPWRQIVGHVTATAKKGDVALLLPNSLEIPFSYYASRLNTPLEIRPLPARFPAMGTGRPYPSGNMAEPAFTPADAWMLESLDCQWGSIWTIMRLPDIFDPKNVILGHLNAKCSLAEGGRLPGIYIYRFVGKKGKPGKL